MVASSGVRVWMVMTLMTMVNAFISTTSRSPTTPRHLSGRRTGSMEMLLKLPRDVRDSLAVGDVVVPIARRSGENGVKLEFELRRRLSQLGLYAGVEYRVEAIEVRPEEKEGEAEAREGLKSLDGLADEERGRAYVRLRPVYKLSKRYERKWPIEVPFSTLPTLLQPIMYNTATLIASLTFSLTILLIGLVGRNFVSLSYVVSHSMEPTMQPGDLLVVDNVSHYFTKPTRGSLVAFHPPPALKEVAMRRGEKLREDQGIDDPSVVILAAHDGGVVGLPVMQVFFKRVACLSGDHALLTADHGLVCQTPQEGMVTPRGVATTIPSQAIIKTVGGGTSLSQPQDVLVPKDGTFVVGDNPGVSIDSRVWGPVSEVDIVGRPVFRVLPLSRFGGLE